MYSPRISSWTISIYSSRAQPRRPSLIYNFIDPTTVFLFLESTLLPQSRTFARANMQYTREHRRTMGSGASPRYPRRAYVPPGISILRRLTSTGQLVSRSNGPFTTCIPEPTALTLSSPTSGRIGARLFGILMPLGTYRYRGLQHKRPKLFCIHNRSDVVGCQLVQSRLGSNDTRTIENPKLAHWLYSRFDCTRTVAALVPVVKVEADRDTGRANSSVTFSLFLFLLLWLGRPAACGVFTVKTPVTVTNSTQTPFG